MNSKTVATNKKARFDFFLEETFVAGLMLEGWEVKSLREGKLNIKEAYIKDIKGELFLVGARIDPASYINQKDQTEPGRFRKLLLNKRELKNILLFRAYTFHFNSHNILDITKNSIRLLFDSVFFHMVNYDGDIYGRHIMGVVDKIK